MTQQSGFNRGSDPLDELVSQLLACGGVLSQIVSQMIQFEASGRSASDAAPIPEVAHSVIRSVVDALPKRHSRRDIMVAAKIIDEVTKAMCEDIVIVHPDLN